MGYIAEPLRALALPIDTLHPDPSNARTHDERNIAAIVASLSRFGQRLPIVVQKQGMIVRAGNGRLAAAKSLGWTHMACVVVDEQSVDATAYAIADNRTALLADWNEEALAALLQSLPDDARLAAGYDDGELKELLDGLTPPEVVEDEAPAPLPTPVSKTGDLWVLGGHRLLCGDSTKAEDVSRLMNRKRASLFSTDPPYVVGYTGADHPKSKTNVKANGDVRQIDWSGTYQEQDIGGDGREFYEAFVRAALSEALEKNAAWYCWHASRRQAMLEQVWVEAGAFVHQQIIWFKSRPVLTYSAYMWAHEPCLMGWVKGQKPHIKMDYQSGEWPRSVWQIDSSEVESKDHPTSKPIKIFSIPMEMHTKPGDVCYEPFSGSGSQIIAAEQVGRRCYAIELEPVFIDVAVRRWQKLTGKEATHEATGKTWAETAAERGVSVE